MTAQVQAETQSTVWNTVKMVLAILILVAGIAGYYYFADYSHFIRIIGLLGAALLSAGLGLATVQGRALLAYARESRIELSRVVWPTRRETTQSTLLVVTMVFIVGMLLWLLDMLLLWGVQLITGQGG